MVNMELYHQITITDKDGKIVRKTRLKRSKSFVRAFLQIIQSQAWVAIVSILDITNTARNINSGTFVMNAGATVITHGIVAGINTGAAAEANTDYKLDTIIAHGAAAGLLSYGAMGQIAAQVVGANVDYQVNRALLNNSGAAITIKEIGIYVLTINSFCIVRDVVADTAVANGQTATVTYTLRTTV